MSPRINECFRFLSVGLFSTIIDIFSLHVLNEFTAIDKSICFTLSFFLSVLIRFFLDKNVTFRYVCSTRFCILGGLLFAYVLSCVFTYFVGFLFFRCGLMIGFSVIFSKIISIPPVTVSGYLLFKYFVFKNQIGKNV